MQMDPLTVPVSPCCLRGSPQANQVKGLREVEGNLVASTYVYSTRDRVGSTPAPKRRVATTFEIAKVSVYGVGQVYPHLAQDNEIDRRQRFPALLRVPALVPRLFHYTKN